jgi:hypothetical protein
MKRFLVTSTAQATTTEHWSVTAATAEDAERAIAEGNHDGVEVEFIGETVEDEHDREVLKVQEVPLP